jgi:hypothetical protein
VLRHGVKRRSRGRARAGLGTPVTLRCGGSDLVVLVIGVRPGRVGLRVVAGEEGLAVGNDLEDREGEGTPSARATVRRG